MAPLQGKPARRKPRLRGYFASFKVINIYGEADIICPRTSHNFIDVQLVGCGDLDAPLPRKRHEIFNFTDRRDSPCGCPISA